jgi:metal-responsive CopG/Arc/MetJ family transcriptional regulator
MAKVNISLPDGLLAEVDALAEESSLSRSGFVQEAAAHYVAQIRAEQAAAQRDEEIGHAIAQMRELSEVIGGFDSTAVIRADRDSDYGNTPDDE